MVRKGTKEQALLRQIVRGNTIAMKEFSLFTQDTLLQYALDMYRMKKMLKIFYKRVLLRFSRPWKGLSTREKVR